MGFYSSVNGWTIRRGIFIFVLVILAACTKEPAALPTQADPDQIAATLGIPPQAVLDATWTARAPSSTPIVISSTPSPEITLTPSTTPTITTTATITPNPIQLTETAVFQRQTEMAGTQNAPPPPTATPTTSRTPTATISPTPSDTPPPTPALPDNPAPNGVVFASDRDGSSDIWVMQLAGEPAGIVLPLPASDEYMAACHPSGTALMFDSNMGGDREIYLTDYRGSTPRPLTDTTGENFNPIWSPQGDTIAFVSTRAGNSDIWIMDSGGGNVRQITLSTADDIFPSWSPDGNVLFYSSNRNGNFDIFQFNLSTFTESQITSTQDVDELYPVLSPDFEQIAYVAETQRGNPNTGAVFVLDSSNTVKPAVTAEGRVETPFWISPTRLLVSASINNQVQILVVDLVSTQSVVLTSLGQSNRWPRYCFVDSTIFAQLPEVQPTAVQTQAALPQPTATSAVPDSPYRAVSEAPEEWVISRETWTGDEFAFITPAGLPVTTGFLIDNLLNLTWEDASGQHVLMIALEAVDGELASTLIGYTVNDLPGPVRQVQGFDEAIRRQILHNSLRPGPYYMDSVEFTDVNITLNFRVPIQMPGEAPGQYAVADDTAPQGWLISSERWSATELALLAGAGGLQSSVSFVGNQVLYIWTENQDEHSLLVQVQSQEFDLLITPISYTIDGLDEDLEGLEDVLYTIREGILLNSIPPGEFLLSQATFNEGALDLVFLIPPQP